MLRRLFRKKVSKPAVQLEYVPFVFLGEDGEIKMSINPKFMVRDVEDLYRSGVDLYLLHLK